MNFFGIGLPELAVIAAIGLLVFGPKRLPELGRTLGKTLKGFQSASSEFEREFRTAISPTEAAMTDMASTEMATTDLSAMQAPGRDASATQLSAVESVQGEMPQA